MNSKKHAPRMSEPHAGLLAIGLFKLLKCAITVAIGIGVLSLLHKDAAEEVSRWMTAVRIDLENPFVQRILIGIGKLSSQKLGVISIATFAYAIVFATEGIGLLMRRRWAEYLTVIVTCSFIPFEIYELVVRPNIPKAITIAINVAVVIYLIVRLWKDRNLPAGEPNRAGTAALSRSKLSAGGASS
jgi:uncharacterized membrane protein (DUF2068 family)